MNIEIQKQKSTQLLSRERVTCFVHFDGGPTPNRLAIRKAIAKQISKKEDSIIVRHVYQRFGESKAKVIAHVYEDIAVMQQLEPGNLLKKHQKEEKKKTAEQPEKKEEKEE